MTALGIGIVALGLWDIYHSLLHPSGSGALGGRVQSAVWWLSRSTGHRFGSAVGPASMITVVLLWVVLQGVGWALVYLPHVPGGFTYAPGVDPVDYPDAVDALYVSLVTLATLGFGDVVATDPWIRMATPLEALTGFALLTAALTWFTQIYPPLSRRRALALELKSLADVDYAGGLPEEDPVTAARVLDGLAAEVAKARIDFTQHGETYYFQEEDPDLSLARHLPYALALAGPCRRLLRAGGAHELPPAGNGPGAARAEAAGGLPHRGGEPRGDLRGLRRGPRAGRPPLTPHGRGAGTDSRPCRLRRA